MGFSFAIFLLALVHAGAGVWAARRAETPTDAVVRALGAAAVSTILATLIFATAVDWFSFFAYAHVMYLALVVTLPVIGVAGLAARWRLQPPALVGRAPATILLLLVLPAFVGIYATHIEPRWIRVDQHRLTTNSPTIEVDTNLRIGVVADVQTRAIGAHERNAVDRLADSQPDLILVPGDLWQMTADEIAAKWPSFRAYIESLTDITPHVLIVVGDTDHIGWLQRIAETTSAIVLEDDVYDLEINGVPLRVGGITLRERPPASPAQQAVIDTLEDTDDRFTVLLSHRPDLLSDLSTGVDLIVAGHTHGGQVAIPFIGPPVTLSSVPRDVAGGGLHTVDGQAIYVSTGVGLERRLAPQVRFGVRPSVGVIDIVADE